MKMKTNVVTVEINEQEALSVINALQLGIKNEFSPEAHEKAAAELLGLLRGNFQSSTKGINYP